MRCNWQRWLWGLIPLVMVSWVAVQVERDRIQQDLTERAKGVLTELGLPWAGVEATGRDIVLTGRAFQDSEPPRAEETLRNVWGVRNVENRAILPPKIEPFIWSARRRGNRIRLMGYVSDRATRQAVIGLTKAAMPGLEVVDRMNTGRGVPSPDTWLAGLSFALKQLSLLNQGDARLDDLALTISGEAEDAAAYKAVSGALKSGLPKGIKLASAQITAPAVSPYTWSARFAGGQLVMAGHVAGGDKTRADLLAAAKAAAPGVNIVDRMEPAEGAPKGWANAVIALMQELVRLESGTLELKDAALTVGGVAPDEVQAQSIRTALRASVPSAFTLVDQVRVREVKAPEQPVAPPPPQPLPRAEPAPRASAEPPQPAAPTPPAPSQTAPVPPTPTDTPKQAEAPQPTVPAPSIDPGSKQTVPSPIESPKQAAPTPAPERAQKEQVVPAPQPPAEPTPKQAVPAPQPPAEPAPKQAASAPRPPPEPAPKVAAAPTQPPAAPAPSPAVNACQENLNRITNAGHINFATDSAALDSVSFETLDRLAGAARACPGMRIAIEGHTDAEGSAEYNQRLSVRRARAVVAYLVKAGADRKQLEAVGYGPSRPAAPNDTEENMARNRRIEFSVRQQ
jgi:outer membrane protein OmpA-like peptidoglycan-associated protein